MLGHSLAEPAQGEPVVNAKPSMVVKFSMNVFLVLESFTDHHDALAHAMPLACAVDKAAQD